jgi:transcriptional regulator with XRE-family HTH domain
MARGMELRLQRVAARVTIQDLAARMGRSRQTVRRYEQLEVVDPQVVRDYLKALASFGIDEPVAALA